MPMRTHVRPVIYIPRKCTRPRVHAGFFPFAAVVLPLASTLRFALASLAVETGTSASGLALFEVLVGEMEVGLGRAVDGGGFSDLGLLGPAAASSSPSAMVGGTNTFTARRSFSLSIGLGMKVFIPASMHSLMLWFSE